MGVLTGRVVWVAQELLRITRAFPIFVWHRQDWSVLRPYMTMADSEVDELRTAGVYGARLLVCCRPQQLTIVDWYV